MIAKFLARLRDLVRGPKCIHCGKAATALCFDGARTRVVNGHPQVQLRGVPVWRCDGHKELTFGPMAKVVDVKPEKCWGIRPVLHETL